MTAAVLAGEWPREVLSISGPDAPDYLQGQLSADVAALATGDSTLALLLEPTGKLGVVLRLWRTGEWDFVLDADAGAGVDVEARLGRFLLRTDVTIESLDLECTAVREIDGGPGAAPPSPGDPPSAELVARCPWPGVEGVDLIGARARLPEGVLQASPAQLEAVRIRSGWPAHGAEVAGPHCGEVTPAEIGPWLIDASVSFTKGCFVGQELTARIDSRGGNVPRRLRSFELPPGATTVPGDPIFVRGDEEPAPRGTVTSTALDPATGTTVVLGYVHRSAGEDAVLTAGTAGPGGGRS